MGGVLSEREIAEVFAGHTAVDHYEHNKLAAALNEQFIGAGQNHPVRYHHQARPDNERT